MDRPPSAHGVHGLPKDEESAPLVLSADGAFSGPAATANQHPPPSPASARRARSRHRMASRLVQVSAVLFVLLTVASVGHFAPDSATRLVLGARMPDFSGVDASYGTVLRGEDVREPEPKGLQAEGSCSDVLLFLPAGDAGGPPDLAFQLRAYVVASLAATYTDMALVLLDDANDSTSVVGCPDDTVQEHGNSFRFNGHYKILPGGLSTLVRHPAWLSRGCGPPCPGSYGYGDWLGQSRSAAGGGGGETGIPGVASVLCEESASNVLVVTSESVFTYFHQLRPEMVDRTSVESIRKAHGWAVSLGAAEDEAAIMSTLQGEGDIMDYAEALAARTGIPMLQPWISRDVQSFVARNRMENWMAGDYPAIYKPEDQVSLVKYLVKFSEVQCGTHHTYVATQHPFAVREEVLSLPSIRGGRRTVPDKRRKRCLGFTFKVGPTPGDGGRVRNPTCRDRYDETIATVAELMVLARSSILVGDLSTNEGRLARSFRSTLSNSTLILHRGVRPTALRATVVIGDDYYPPALADSHLENSGEVTAAGSGLISASKRTEARINRQLIDDIFRGVDPFARSRVVRPDWTYPHTNWQPVFFEHLWTQYVRPNHGTLDFYLEVGSFKGGSITRLADLLKEKCPDWRKVSLVCMDPFSGDVNMWDWNHNKGTKFGHDFLDTGPDGRPQIFERFLANVADKGHQDMVLPIVVGGLVGMKLIDRFYKTGRIDQLPSVIYLDSAHEKDETFLELEQAWKVLRECGAILGDDWAWDAVREDVVRFAEGRNLPALPIYDKYEQKTPGLVLGPKGQWFIVKNGESCKFDAKGTWGSASQNVNPVSLTVHYMQQRVYDAYKVRIDAKIASIRDRGKPCSEQTTLAYAGEFGYEIQGVVPWRYDEAISTGCDLKTAGLAGTRYLYFFSKHHTTVGGHRGHLPLPNGNPFGKGPHIPELPKTNWKMPPFPSFFGEKGIRYDLRGMVPGPSNKPIAVVFNKYTLEWGKIPVNYLDIESLRSLLNILSPVYQVVYVRLESKKLGDNGEGDLQDFKDKDVIRQEYPSTILIDDLYNEATMDYNLLLFGVASQADLFVSVQGGNCVIASLWGKPNFIYAVKGGELWTGAFKYGWMGQLSGADHESFVTVYDKREKLIQGVQVWMDGAALWRGS